MDPVTITTSCICVLGAIGKTAFAITTFVKSCREARGDLAEINRELSDLKMVLELLRDDSDVQDSRILPQPLQRQILSLLDKCGEVLAKIDIVLANQAGRFGELRWVLKSKNDVANLRQSLEGYRTALSLALDLVTVVLAKEIKVDTRAIRLDTADIKQDTSRILSEIDRLRTRTTSDENAEKRNGSTGLILHRYLDDLTTYAETVSDDVEYQNDHNISLKIENQPHLNTSAKAAEIDSAVYLPGLSIPRRSTNQIDLERIRRDSYEAGREHERRESERRRMSELGSLSTSQPVSPCTSHKRSNFPTADPITQEPLKGLARLSTDAEVGTSNDIELVTSDDETLSDVSMYTCPSFEVSSSDLVYPPFGEELRTGQSKNSIISSTLRSGHGQSHSDYAFSYQSTFGSAERHKDDVIQVAISPNASLMATLHKNGVVKIWKDDTAESPARTWCVTQVREPLSVMNLGVKAKFRMKRPSSVKHIAFSDDIYIVIDVFRGSRLTMELWDWKSNRMVSDIPTQTHEGWNDSMTGMHARLTQHKFQFYQKGLDGFQEIRSLYFDTKVPYAISPAKHVFEFCRNAGVMDIAMAVTNVMCSAPMLAIIRKDTEETLAEHAEFSELNGAIPKGVASENMTVWSLWLKQDSSAWYILTWDLSSSNLRLTEIAESPPDDCRLSPDGKCLVAWRRSSFSVLDGKTGARICNYNFPSIALEETPKIKTAKFSQDSEILVVGLSRGWGQVFRKRTTAISSIADRTSAETVDIRAVGVQGT